jgi:hypothetical protein
MSKRYVLSSSTEKLATLQPFLLIICTHRIFTEPALGPPLHEAAESAPGSVGFSDVPANGRILLRQLRHLKHAVAS